MHNISGWDWEIGKKLIADISTWKGMFENIEEPYVSPDGEKVAAVVKTGEMEFSVCENDAPWERRFDKIWYLKFGPDNRLTALVSDTGAWTVAVDGEVWENTFDFVWNTKFGTDGKNITVAAQKEMEYFAVTNDIPWETRFSSLSNLTISRDGKRVAGVVPTVEVSEGEIFKFQEGCYSAVVDGKPWDTNFVNVWDMAFSSDAEHVAAEVRTSLYDYTIAVDGVSWDQIYTSVWMPQFSPANGSV
ncbi:MAG: WD40 repeat domain-containing protein, partial [Deltaproteobacteria bacterium]|nr:WD40 repeat domain-containing protein [Deltaproteobacteria bacterium]